MAPSTTPTKPARKYPTPLPRHDTRGDSGKVLDTTYPNATQNNRPSTTTGYAGPKSANGAIASSRS